MPNEEKRLRRQFEALGRGIPASRGFIRSLLEGRMRYARIPIAVALIAGGLAGFLPVLGLWMLPLGLLLLAVDAPALRPMVSAGFIRSRRTLRIWRRRYQRRRGH